jgi:hypothetical protein
MHDDELPHETTSHVPDPALDHEKRYELEQHWLNAEAARLTHLLRMQSGAVGREPLAKTTIGPALSQ